MKKQSKSRQQFKESVLDVHKEWRAWVRSTARHPQMRTLRRFADKVCILNKAAKQTVAEEKTLQAQQQIHHLLSTPWGAPFVEEKTFLEAAQKCRKHPSLDSAFFDFLQLSRLHRPIPFFQLVQAIRENLK